MAWIQITFHVPSGSVEALSDALTEAGALAITTKDAADDAILEPDPGQTPLWPNVELTGLFEAGFNPEPLIKSLGDTPPAHRIETLEDQAWERAWLAHFKPMCFGERLWVYPSDYTLPDAEVPVVLLDPGLAFGTGTHETTALCLNWLATHNLVGQEVIDFGCGSGILAIAALKLGAKSAVAIDHDPQAVQATLDNAKKNHLSQSALEVYQPHEHTLKPADLVIANILAEPLIALSKKLIALTKPEGHIILSGLLREQVGAVTACYQDAFPDIEAQYMGDWVRLVGTKVC